jgi:hypothetical protein
VLPALLEQSHTRAWLKAGVRGWCVAVAWLLGLRSYLLGQQTPEDEEEEAGDAQGGEEADGGDAEEVDDDPLDLGAAHQVRFAFIYDAILYDI